MLLAKTERALTAIGASSPEIRFYVRNIEKQMQRMTWRKRIWNDLRISCGIISILVVGSRRQK